jgi:Cys-rich protein (TIGR01571 family)
MVAQIAHKTEYAKFDTILTPYIILYIVITIISLFLGNIVYLVPFFVVFILALLLRFHVVKKYNIEQNGKFMECLIGCFCCPCSIAQSEYQISVSLLLR